jgi:hypothetical protein
MSIEIKIGKTSFPVIGVASLPDNDFLIVFVAEADGKLWGQSVKTKTIAPLKFKNGHTTWGNKIVRFI